MTQINEGPYIPHVFGDEVTELFRSHRGWLTAAVHHSIPWPEKDVLVTYDGEDFFLMGIKQQGEKLGPACIIVRYNDQKTLFPTLNRIYKFTSVLGWFMRGYVDVVGYMSGSHPTRYTHGNPPYAPTISGGPIGFNCNFMPIVEDENARKALAFWREGLRLANIHMGYSFLSFYKVIESQFKTGKTRAKWIENAIPTLADEAADRVKKLSDSGIDVGKHIYESGRCAIAHASLDGNLIDPDIPEDKARITQDQILIQALAKKIIRDELKIPDETDLYKHRDALKVFYEYINPAHIETLQNGGSIPPQELSLNGLEVCVNQWPHNSPPEFQNLKLDVSLADNGSVIAFAMNEKGTLALGFLLDFTERKAKPLYEQGGATPPERGGEPKDCIAFLEHHKAVICNALIELTFPNNEKLVCEPVIPVNIDLGRSCQAMDEIIEKLRGNREENSQP